MASFSANVVSLVIEEHPNADALELARIGDYRAVVAKGKYQTGDLAVYIPEQAVVPDWIIEKLNLVGRLAGKQKNRVKAIKLRGVLSQGLVYPINNRNGYFWIELENDSVEPVQCGEDVTDLLGITKYEPPIPVHMAGEVFNAHGCTLSYDIENLKRYPDTFLEGEDVVITEKLHGTWCCFGYHPDIRESYVITSKGLSKQGLAFKINEANENNLYIRALDSTTPYENGTGGNVLDRVLADYGLDTPIYLLGEVFGKGVQDLNYGVINPTFRLFDVYIGDPGSGRYMNANELEAFAARYDVLHVPVFHTGPFSKEVVEQFTSGQTVLGADHIREGIVIKPAQERYNNDIGRVIAKSVSDDYLTRKGGTEYN